MAASSASPPYAALSLDAVRTVAAENVEFLAALLDTANYEMSAWDAAGLVAKVIMDRPTLMDAILAEGLSLTRDEAAALDPFYKYITLAQVCTVTVEAHPPEDLLRAVLAEVQPASLLLSGTRH
jgi:hypothetical protein